MRVAVKILKWLGIGLAALLVLGFVYQTASILLDGEYAPPESERVAVNGRMVHVVCMGQGPQTFVLDAGAGAWSFEWYRVQPLLAKGGRVCAFDRAGSGWSDSSDTGFDGVSKSDELAVLVRAAKIPRPFFYVGHSLGANYAQIYYAKYPADIAGLVLIEPGDPKDLLEDTTGSRAETMAGTDCGATCYLAGALSYVGIPRIAAHLMITGRVSLTPEERDLYIAGLGRPSTVMATVAYLNAVPKVAYQDRDVKSFGDTPVITFDSTLPRDPEGKETVADVKVWKKGQLAFLGALSAKSTRGVGPVHIPNASHSSMVMGASQAKFLADAILKFAAANQAH